MTPNDSGAIIGRVVEVGTGQPLPGVSILLLGTELGAATNLNGGFEISNVPPTSYTLRASFIGFISVEYKPLQIEKNRTYIVDFFLAPVEQNEALF